MINLSGLSLTNFYSHLIDIFPFFFMNVKNLILDV